MSDPETAATITRLRSLGWAVSIHAPAGETAFYVSLHRGDEEAVGPVKAESIAEGVAWATARVEENRP